MINFDGGYASLVTYASEFSGATLDRKPSDDLSAVWFSPVSDASNGNFRLQSNCKPVSITRLLPCFHEAAAISVMRSIIYTRTIVVRLHMGKGSHSRCRKTGVVVFKFTKAASFDACLPAETTHLICLELTGLKHKPIHMLEVVSLISTTGFLDSNWHHVGWALSSVRELASILYVSHPHHRFLIPLCVGVPTNTTGTMCNIPAPPRSMCGRADVTHLTYIDGRGSIDVER